MELLYLGTAAAEGAPALFCDCEFCRYARKVGGREIRGRSGALLDGKLKLDFGPDSFKQMLDNGIDYTHIHSLLITHTHEDHLALGDISCRRRGFGQLPEGEAPLTLYGNEKLGDMLKPMLCDRIAYQRVRPFEPYEIEGYSVTPLEAVHCVSNLPGSGYPVVFENRAYCRGEEAMFYLIEKDGASVLYAHDTDEFTPADMEFLAGKKIGLISLDCTNGSLNADYVGHMGARDNLRLRDKLLADGAADSRTVFVANHFSHNGLVPFEELEALLPGFVVSYDGMKIAVPEAKA